MSEPSCLVSVWISFVLVADDGRDCYLRKLFRLPFYPRFGDSINIDDEWQCTVEESYYNLHKLEAVVWLEDEPCNNDYFEKFIQELFADGWVLA